MALSLGALLMWGLLPIALSGLLEHMDAMTITWFQSALAGAVLVVAGSMMGALSRSPWRT